jgi:NAD(P) transhydrogenase
VSQKKAYDVVVIGTGPGGEGAAMQAAKLNLRVAVIEREPVVGGACTHLGTIPSKTLRHLSSQLVAYQTDPLLASLTQPLSFSFADIVQRSRSVIASQVQLRSSHYMRNQVELLHGNAYIESPTRVRIDGGYGHAEVLETKAIVIATGSRPYHPKDMDFSHPRIVDSDSVLDMKIDPRIITVLGAGVIGCEYTSIFKSLGKKVNLINNRSKLLSFLDDEIVDALSYHLRDQGVLIRHNEYVDNVELSDDQVILVLKSGKRIRSDVLMVAAGRTGNTENMGLENVPGVEVDNRGYVKVNGKMQTGVPSIYAVGDVIGFPSLANAAYDQGRYASLHVHNADVGEDFMVDIPLGIYTTPEISCIGKTEAELTADRVPYEVGQTVFRHLARAQITRQTLGMLKILFNRETLEILGIHCFGQNASEIIHIGQAVMRQKGSGNTIKYFVNTTFNYPTMAEAYRVAALNGLNRVC